LGKGANVYLASAELSAITAILGRIPSMDEYMKYYNKNIKQNQEEIYNYLDFSK
jgi:aconitate hydratase 2/2-methylisocitrate dehydratase